MPAVLGWTFLLVAGTTAFVMLFSLVAPLVPPLKRAGDTQRGDASPDSEVGSQQKGHRNTLLHLVPRMYLIFDRKRGDIQWASLRYTYVAIFFCWLIGPTLLLTMETLFLLGWGSAQLFELLGEATFYDVYGNDPADFWVPVGFGVPSLLLLLLSSLTLVRSGKRLLSARKIQSELPLHVGQWRREFASPLLWLIIWAWIASLWSGVLLVAMAFYALGNIGG